MHREVTRIGGKWLGRDALGGCGTSRSATVQLRPNDDLRGQLFQPDETIAEISLNRVRGRPASQATLKDRQSTPQIFLPHQLCVP